MKIKLRSGVLCIEHVTGPVIFDTGSPVSLGSGEILDLDGVKIETKRSLMIHSWDAIQDSLPFSANALIGTDQLNQMCISIDIHNQIANWVPSLAQGSKMEMLAGVPVIEATINGRTGHFFFDTGASICYVTDEEFFTDINPTGRFDDFHPMLGEFSTDTYTCDLSMSRETTLVNVGLLPQSFALMMTPFGVDGIIGTNAILTREMQLDFENNLFQFPKANGHVPHDSWSDSYDDIFEASFGALLDEITELTMEVILQIAEPTENILDIGCGTGRMTLPLIESGFYVSALDPSAGMLKKLDEKITDQTKLELINSQVSDLNLQEEFEGALCLFTVSSYWLDEIALHNSIKAIYRSLVPNGWLIIDRTLLSSFTNTSFITDAVNRSSTVENLTEDLYRFTEDSVVSDEQGPRRAFDSFLIRYWDEDVFLKKITQIGFILEENLSKDFEGAGASFYLLRKA